MWLDDHPKCKLTQERVLMKDEYKNNLNFEYREEPEKTLTFRDLKPCKRCGSGKIHMSNSVLFPDRWLVECENCHFSYVIDGEQNAIRKWNDR
jgi:hypothetical protein